MSAQSSFFSQAQVAAVFKHGIERNYLPKFAGKLGSTAEDHRVAYGDGYAGRGLYDDGTPGSPALAIETAEGLANVRHVDCFFIERNRDNYRALKEYVESVGSNAVVCHGDVQDHIHDLLDFAGNSPLFLFLDPFGLGVSLETLGLVLARSKASGRFRGGPPTELLLNFSIPGLERAAGLLTSTPTTETAQQRRESTLNRLDEVLGGDWWREIWMDGQEDRTPRIMRRYIHLLARTAGSWYVWAVPVSDRMRGRPDYYLIFVTHNAHGLWEFNDAVARARKKAEELAEPPDSLFQQEQLFDPEPDIVDEIKTNIETLLIDGRGFRLIEKTIHVLGDALGRAHGPAIRKAIKELHADGKTASDGKGDLLKMRILPPRRV